MWSSLVLVVCVFGAEQVQIRAAEIDVSSDWPILLRFSMNVEPASRGYIFYSLSLSRILSASHPVFFIEKKTSLCWIIRVPRDFIYNMRYIHIVCKHDIIDFYMASILIVSASLFLSPQGRNKLVRIKSKKAEKPSSIWCCLFTDLNISPLKVKVYVHPLH